jgi:antitoxin (DNA-binding transcriptional repressor) of toxin-antitoxin stability system
MDGMGELKTVGVKELKNNLSAYLREVRRGIRVLVSDRNRVVAELHEPVSGYAVDDPRDPRLAEWIEAGVLSPPTVRKSKLPPSPVRLAEGTAARLLDADRGKDRR